MNETPFPDRINPSLELADILEDISGQCIECGLCVKQCAFLKKYGTPKSIADGWKARKQAGGNMPFACSLCSLCTAVCPVAIDPREMFLAMRCHSVRAGETDLTRQKPLLAFERWGTSRLFSFYGLPENCHSVFFPGCALSGSRAHRVIALYEKLSEIIPDIGIVLDCCTKPSHDLGRWDFFQAMFYEMYDYLADHGVQEVVTACPSCQSVFAKYTRGINVRSIYEIIAAHNWQPAGNLPKAALTVQDSCVARFEDNLQDSVRNLISSLGVEFTEMKHCRKKTLCCGEGGGAHFVAPDLANQWGEIRRLEGEGRRMITYCAGCANFLGRVSPTAHLVDLILDPAATLTGKAEVARTPMTYLKRLQLKRWFRKRKKFFTTRARDFLYRSIP